MRPQTAAKGQVVTAAACSANDTDRPLRILMGLEGLALGGCPINALDLGRTLRLRGHQVDVFAIDEQVKVSLLPYAEHAGFDVTLLPPDTTLRALASGMRELAGRLRSDIVHVHGPWLGPAAAVVAARRGSSAAVVTNWTMENAFYTGATPLIVGTPAMQREARSRLPARVWLLEPPVDLAADRPDAARASGFRAERDLGGAPLVVIVSRLDTAMKAEGITHAIDAMARLDHATARLVVVGDGDAAERLRARGTEVNRVAGRELIHFVGAMADPRGAYAAADVVLGMGGSAIRALAHGRPLVVLGEEGFARTFDETSRQYFLDDGFYGRGGPVDGAGHLAALIGPLLDDPGLRRTLGELGLAQARDRYSLDSAAITLEQVYVDALARRPRGAGRAWVAGGMLARRGRHLGVRRARGLASSARSVVRA